MVGAGGEIQVEVVAARVALFLSTATVVMPTEE